MSVSCALNPTMNSQGFPGAASHASGQIWTSVNCEDFSEDDFWMSDDESWPFSDTLGRESVRVIPQRPRIPYGSGIDARKTASFRQFDFRRSGVYQLLQQVHPTLTKETLRKVINNILENCPVEIRPKELTRSQKRSKRGLGLWLQENVGLVTAYVAAHSSGQLKKASFANLLVLENIGTERRECVCD
jgi:hypothetical protein